ncbi:MAG: DUF6470 family protein [Syntrophomonadaceae bacterium]|nr:DUF6470 family protein [Syntrophomonadaceae bacterium]
MDLRITQQPALVGLDIHKPAIKLNTTLPYLDVKTTPVSLQIDNPPAKLELDWTQCRADMGLKNQRIFCQDTAQLSLAQGLEAIGTIAADGDALGRIEAPTSVEQLVASRLQAESEVDYNVALMPEHPPEVNVETNGVEVTLEPQEVNCNLQRGIFENKTAWAKVDMYLLQKPSINVEWVGSYYDAIA